MRYSGLCSFLSLLSLTAGCGNSSGTPSPSGSTSPPPARTAAPPATASAAPTTPASAAPSPSGSAPASASAAPAAGNDLKTMFSGPPEAGTKDSETVTGTGGVVLGFPAGWKSANADGGWYTGYRSPEIAVGIRGVDIMCGEAAKVDKNELQKMAYTAFVEKVKWEDPVDGTVGVGAYPAKIARGTGQQVPGKHEPVIAYYVHTTIPGAKAVLCVGAHPASHPELEKDLVTAFKGLKGSKPKK